MTMMLSVVIPVYNGAATLARAFEALAGQEFTHEWECLVVDNGSEDLSRHVATEWSDRLPLRWITATEQRGQVYARNRGAAEAKGTYLLFLDQDDEAGTGYLSGMAAAMATSDFVAARLDPQKLNTPDIAASRAPAHQDNLAHDYLPWAYGCTLGIKRDVFLSVGGFRYFGGGAEDQDLCWRLQLAGTPLILAEGAVLHYRFRTEASAIFRQGYTYGRSAAAVYRAHRTHGMQRCSTAQTAFAAVSGVRMMASFNRSRRLAGVFRIGNRLGRVAGSIRSRVLFF